MHLYCEFSLSEQEILTQLSGLSMYGLSGNLTKDKAASWSHGPVCNSLRYSSVRHTE